MLGDARLEGPLEGQWGRAKVIAKLANADALISLLSLGVDEELMSAGPQLKVIANYAVGYDNIDLQAATARNIVVTNTPDVLTNATADLAFALLLSAARRMGEAERLVRSGLWQGWAPQLLLGGELHGKTIGVLGAGRIGSAVLRRAQGFSMQLRYASPRLSEQAEKLGALRLDPASLFEECDFVSIHCPLTPDTTRCVDAGMLASMKKTAILVNTARGGVVDTEALAEALQRGTIAGAGLDVFDDEPEVPEMLLACETAVLMPHIGSATHTARKQMAEICARAVESVLRGECPTTAVNPEAMA